MVIEEMDPITVIKQDQAEEASLWIMGMRFGFIPHPIVETMEIVVEIHILETEEEDVVELMVHSIMSTNPMEVVVIESMVIRETQGMIVGEEGDMDRIEVVEEEGMDREMVGMVDPEDLPMEVGEVHVVEVVEGGIIKGIIENLMFHGNCHQMIRVEIAMTDLQEIGIVLEEIGTSDDGL